VLDKIINKLAGYIAVRVTEELVRRLPDIIEVAIEALPDAYEGIAETIIDRLLGRLPFPFKN
jgi:hypothetical protein